MCTYIYSVLELCQFLTSVFPHCYSVCFWCNDVSQHFTFESSFIIVFTVSLSHRYWPTPADALFSPDTNILLLLLKVACNDFLTRVWALSCELCNAVQSCDSEHLTISELIVVPKNWGQRLVLVTLWKIRFLDQWFPNDVPGFSSTCAMGFCNC